MSVTGQVKNGVVILPPGTKLPEGAQVCVQPITNTDPLVDAVQNLAKRRDHLPNDYALNHGHHAGGEPKR